MGIADVNAYYNLAFVRWIAPEGAKLIDAFEGVIAGGGRIQAIGHGHRKEMDRKEALAIARESTSIEVPAADPGEPNGRKPGDAVTVMADDYGRDPIAGELVSSSAQHIAIKRNDPLVGDVTVHFPRAGFFVV